jgi:hypothetical protein
MRKRVKLQYSATRGWHVDLPSYRMIDGTFEPVTANLMHANGVLPGARVAAVLALGPTVEVEVPAADCRSGDGAVEIDLQKIHARYPQWAKRAAPDV